jgi:catechol 2,3-dioxygenase-like lactoylglutathione lyase family enzyme
MDVEFVAGFAVITQQPDASARLYEHTLGLQLDGADGYRSTNDLAGLKHFGVWPLPLAAEACFGSPDWPSDIPVPQATIEFEIADVAAGVAELETAGYRLLHGARTEPWGQTVARLSSPEGLLIGLTHTPWLRDDGDIGL